MAVFNRNKSSKKNQDSSSNSDGDSSHKQKKIPFAQRKPANTAFKQQRLKAWQPILTPKTVLPTFFLLGIILAPIGAVLYYFSNKVNEFTIDYTDCMSSAPTDTTADVPSDKYNYQLHDTTPDNFQPPQWQIQNGSCNLFFSVPTDLEGPVFLYYKMTNYYQNHRRYVKSIDTDQLLGENVAYSTVDGGNCKPLDVESSTRKIIYPCGLIANSVFNDVFDDPVMVGTQTETPYNMTDKGIVWPGEKNKYKKSDYTIDQVIPPPLWRTRAAGMPYSYPNNYTEQDPIYDPSEDEHFMVWMRTAGLPTFRKLYKRQDNNAMPAGRYRMVIHDNYPVSKFHGTKSIVFSTVSWVGGRNPFLGLAYIAVAGLCILLGLIFTARHLIRPRKLGDMSHLSWNMPPTSN